MTDILIRNVPEELNMALKVAAAAHGVSRESYVLSTLQNNAEVQAARILLDALDEIETKDPKAGWYEVIQREPINNEIEEEENDVP